MLALIVLAAAEKPDKTFFYICGGALAVWAVVVSAVGIRAHETFPATESATRTVMTVSVVLVLLTMASAVLTS
jgi:hypothetical protein